MSRCSCEHGCGGSRERSKLRQTALILVGIGLIVALAPMSVTAAGQLMTIVDPSTNNAAKVDSGRLRVGDGTGPMTVDGTVRVNDGSGALTVDGSVRVNDGSGALTVDGSVNEAPAATWVRFTFHSTEQCSGPVYTIPAGKALIIKSVQGNLSRYNGTGYAFWSLRSDASCWNTVVEGWSSEQAKSDVQNYEPGIAVPAGTPLYQWGFNNGGRTTIIGYLVPAAAVPASALSGSADANVGGDGLARD